MTLEINGSSFPSAVPLSRYVHHTNEQPASPATWFSDHLTRCDSSTLRTLLSVNNHTRGSGQEHLALLCIVLVLLSNKFPVTWYLGWVLDLPYIICRTWTRAFANRKVLAGITKALIYCASAEVSNQRDVSVHRGPGCLVHLCIYYYNTCDKSITRYNGAISTPIL